MSEPTQKTKNIVDTRDQRRCAVCGQPLDGKPGSRHHRKMRSQASAKEVHTVSNVIDVCGTGTTGCHGEIHANPRWAYSQGFLVHSYETSETALIHHALYGWCYLKSDGSTETWEESK